jgi:high affinity choline transporter 7
LPYVLNGAGGLHHAWSAYAAARPDGVGIVQTTGPVVSWWDTSLMLIFGGIPWNCYFQRVLSCRTPRDARRQSIFAGVMTIAFTVPPLLMGIAAFSYPWPADIVARLRETPADAMPLLFAHAVPSAIGVLGLAAIVGAVTSSFSSSILSAGSMLSWNCFKRLVWPSLSVVQMKRTIRGSILLFGAIATVLALKVQSVQALWFFTSDLVFVLLFPQLLFALFDRRANLPGSVTAFVVSLVLRIGGGEPLLGLPAFIAYPETVPFKTVAALAGIVLLPVVSRATVRWTAAQPLRNPAPA